MISCKFKIQFHNQRIVHDDEYKYYTMSTKNITSNTRTAVITLSDNMYFNELTYTPIIIVPSRISRQHYVQ